MTRRGSVHAGLRRRRFATLLSYGLWLAGMVNCPAAEDNSPATTPTAPAAPAVAAGTEATVSEATPEPAQPDPIVIMYMGAFYCGWYLGSDAETIFFDLRVSPAQPARELAWTWAQAQPVERKMMLRQFGLAAVGDIPAFGEQVTADKITFENGLVYYGFLTPAAAADLPAQSQFDGARIKHLLLGPNDRYQCEKVKVAENQVYTLLEMVQRRTVSGGELAKGAAAEQFRLAQYCLRIVRPTEGLAALATAGKLDAQFQPADHPAVHKLQQQLQTMAEHLVDRQQLLEVEAAYRWTDYPHALAVYRQFRCRHPDQRPQTASGLDLGWVLEQKIAEQELAKGAPVHPPDGN